MQIKFAGHCLDLATRQLLRGEIEVPLSPKALELLRVLIDNRARAVSKSELHEHLWPDTFVTDANLSVLVAELRRAFHDRPGTPAFIRTVRGFGYAFCAKVSGDVDTSAAARRCWIVFGSREIALQEGDNLIGRDRGVTVRVDLPSVSRRHARIVVSRDEAIIEDLGSKNGTFLRNHRLTGPVQLADFDELQLGPARLVVRILTGDTAATQTIAGS